MIYTVIVNGYDRLIEPIEAPGWSFVCFTDGGPTSWRARLGLSKWEVRQFSSDAPTPTLRSRAPKILPHKYLPEFDYSIYIDGNAFFLKDPNNLVKALEAPRFGAGLHRFRNTIFQELDECNRLGMAAPEVLENQRRAYLNDGCPSDLTLLENNLLLRAHNDPSVIELNEAWWQELNTHAARDQLSLPYAAWKLGFDISSFTVNLKYSHFSTKAHYRSVWLKCARSLKKRLSAAASSQSRG